MRNTLFLSGAAAVLAASLGATSASAAPALRVQVDQRGSFLLIGNTLGYDCAAVGPPTPIVNGTLAANACAQTSSNLSDSSPDVFWRADDPADGQALADTSTLPADARASAVLTIPPGAKVTHAFLYWAATNTTGIADPQVTLDRPGAAGFAPVTINAIQSWAPGLDKAYQSVADVTKLVQANGSGAYRVSDIDVAPFANVNVSVLFGGFWMVVFYEDATQPLNNLALFDGFDVVSATGGSQTATLSGFKVPNSGFSGRLGVVAFEGDNTATGDGFKFNGTALFDAQNPVDNFFNGSHSSLGLPVSNVGDLPQMSGVAGSMSGIDIDVVDITGQLTAGQTSASVEGTTAAPVGDTYFLGGFVTSISTLAPDFSTSTKSATDLNGGLLLPGDTLHYSITVTNTGNDASIKTVLTDVLPPEVTYVPGSLKIGASAAAGQGEYTDATRTITARLGSGATATDGGSIAVAASITVSFDVTINAGASGNVSNQGSIVASGKLGAPPTTVLTDGNGVATGAPPTVVFVDLCATNADCKLPTPVCDTTASPHVCVCNTDADCGDATSGQVCDATKDSCVPGCRGTGGNGCPTGDDCSSTTNDIGQCAPPATASSSVASSSSSASSGAGGSGGEGGGTSASVSSSSSSVASSGGTGGAGGAGSTASSSGAGGDQGTGGAGGGAMNGITASGGCGCQVSTGENDLAWGGLGLALAGVVAGRRRKRG